MKALVVYDTKWGNTEKVALAVAAGLGKGAQASNVSEVAASSIAGLDLVVIGSPVFSGKPPRPIRELLALHRAAPGHAAASEPMGLIVKGQKRRLEDAELARAEQWGTSLAMLMQPRGKTSAARNAIGA